MRKSSAFEAAQAFIAGRALRGASSCYSTGSALWSYGTIIAARAEDGRVIHNATRYSVTTTRHQTAARMAAGLAGQGFSEVHGLPRGATDRDLLAMAR